MVKKNCGFEGSTPSRENGSLVDKAHNSMAGLLKSAVRLRIKKTLFLFPAQPASFQGAGWECSQPDSLKAGDTGAGTKEQRVQKTFFCF